jgi:hypothetical protein
VVKRVVVGAHYGWRGWLTQRVTAVIMAVYTLLLLGVALYHGGIGYSLWKALFGHGAFRIATLLFDRIGAVRSAARFVFRDDPDTIRQVTSAYERKRRAKARRGTGDTPPAGGAGGPAA